MAEHVVEVYSLQSQLAWKSIICNFKIQGKRTVGVVKESLFASSYIDELTMSRGKHGS